MTRDVTASGLFRLRPAPDLRETEETQVKLAIQVLPKQPVPIAYHTTTCDQESRILLAKSLCMAHATIARPDRSTLVNIGRWKRPTQTCILNPSNLPALTLRLVWLRCKRPRLTTRRTATTIPDQCSRESKHHKSRTSQERNNWPMI